MILANFNRSLNGLFVLTLLTATGCSQQPISRLTLDQATLHKIDKDGVSLAHKIDKDGSTIVLAKQETPKAAKKIIVAKKEPKAEPKPESIWSRMISLYAFPKVDNARVDEEVKKFLKHPSHLVRVQRRAEPYLHLIMDEIEAKKLPGELALLPIIESSFRANVSSPASAAGLWQFIPSTGRSFGLKQNWWYDGRRDVYSSTQAATRYLKQLHKSFKGDWFLALASYNVGLGNVRKAIKKNKAEELESDYWALNLPKETEDYVPKLLALAKIFANAEKYNLPLKSIPDKPFFKVVNIKSQIDLKKAAIMAGMKFNDFFVLNPAFNRVITAPNGPHRLLVKADKVKAFKRKLAKLPKSKRVNWVKHKVAEGEDLKAIAKKHKTTIKNLLKVNNLKKKQIKEIKVGKTLKIPPVSIKVLTKGKA
ncbi:MAG: transglycosylase SLT domain-containing protein [Methylococcaceae bacterium]|nr:transglycosylase SLT domain-containing protein [Methylococcaceae bacterium]